MIVLFLTALGSFYWISQAALGGHDNAFDLRIMELRKSFVTPALVRLMKGITFLGDRRFLLPAYCLLAGIILIRRNYPLAIMIACAGIGAGLLDDLFKDIYQRTRPGSQEIAQLTTYSFPSGHASASFVFGSVLIFLTWQMKWPNRWKWMLSIFLFFFILTVGFSRIVLNVHYATDVVGGFLLGLMWVIVCYAVVQKVNRIGGKTIIGND